MVSETIVFLGDSLIERFEEINNTKDVLNFGVSGDKTIDLIARLDEVYTVRPDKLFLLVGINDLLYNYSDFRLNSTINIERTYESIIRNLRKNLDETELYVISILPVNTGLIVNREQVSLLNREIIKMNHILKKFSNQYQTHYIDVHQDFKNQNNALEESYSIDGVHLTKMGYKKLFKKISTFCNNLRVKNT